MLYHMHELQHAALAPMRALAETMQQFYSHPWMPLAYTKVGRTMAAGFELLERTTRRYPKPEFGLPFTTIDGEKVAVREVRVSSRTFCDLIHFERDTKRVDPKVLVVAPMSGHYATLLRGTVEDMLPDHDIYITDWVDAREVPVSRGGFDLDDYIDYVREFLTILGPNTHVLAVCQPSVPVLAAVSLQAEEDCPYQPASMTLMGGPIDTRVNPTKVNEVAHKNEFIWFEKNAVYTVPSNHPGRGRKVYPGFVQLVSFMSMNIDRHMDAHVKLFEHLVEGDGDSAEQHRDFYDEYLAVMDLPAEFYLQTIKAVFQDHSLPCGTFNHRGRIVNPAAITQTALMTVEGERDDITGPGQTQAAHDLCANIPAHMKRHHLQPKVGHYGVFHGRRWREEILPNVRDFIRSNDAVLGKKTLRAVDTCRVGVAV